MNRFPLLPAFLSLLVLAALPLLAACGGDDGDGSSGANGKTTLRLGYFANVTHAPGLVAVADGSLTTELGENVTLEVKVFNAGPAVIEALFVGEIDASYIGPNPAINGFQQSRGEALRIVSGAASGGALLVVRPGANINSPADFANKRVATPQLGNTQDVALRSWLQSNGLKGDTAGGNVKILPTANADALSLFQRGDIDAAWAPEPWATRLVQEAGGQVFLDEKTLWPEGKFVTTQLIVATKYLEKNPAVIEALVRANVKAIQFINQDPERGKEITNKAILDLTSKGLAKETIDGAWKNLEFTYDPIVSSLAKSANDAFNAGLLRDDPNLKGIYSLNILNKVLAELQLPLVKE